MPGITGLLKKAADKAKKLNVKKTLNKLGDKLKVAYKNAEVKAKVAKAKAVILKANVTAVAAITKKLASCKMEASKLKELKAAVTSVDDKKVEKKYQGLVSDCEAALKLYESKINALRVCWKAVKLKDVLKGNEAEKVQKQMQLIQRTQLEIDIAFKKYENEKKALRNAIKSDKGDFASKAAIFLSGDILGTAKNKLDKALKKACNFQFNYNDMIGDLLDTVERLAK